MALESTVAIEKMEGGLKDPELFRAYCQMIVSRFPARDIQDEEEMADAPFNSLFYYLISGFYMFVLGEPGHPIGLPFPGGFTVQWRDGEAYCPIRDKEKDVEYSICNYCPAKQDAVP